MSNFDSDQIREAKDQIFQLELELAEFQASSRELERELELELEESEERHKKSELIINRLTIEINDWKEKHRDLQKEYTTFTASLQREITSLKDAHSKSSNRLREIEMTNDDMERNERITKSTLEDMEQKYFASLEQVAMLEAELAARDDSKAQIQRLKDELRETTEELSVANIRIQKLTNQIEIQNEHIKKTAAASAKSRKSTLSLRPSSSSLKSGETKDTGLTRSTSMAFKSNETNRLAPGYNDDDSDDDAKTIRNGRFDEAPKLSSNRNLRKFHGMLDQMKVLESRVANFKSSLPLPATPISGPNANNPHGDSNPHSSPPATPRQTYHNGYGHNADSIGRHERQTSRGPMSPGGTTSSNIPILKARTYSTSSTDNESDIDFDDEFNSKPSIDKALADLRGDITKSQSSFLQEFRDSNPLKYHAKTFADSKDDDFSNSKHDTNSLSHSKSYRISSPRTYESNKENKTGLETPSRIKRSTSGMNNLHNIRPSTTPSSRYNQHDRTSSFANSSSSNNVSDTSGSKYSRSSTMSLNYHNSNDSQPERASTISSRTKSVRDRSLSRGVGSRSNSSQGSYPLRNGSSNDSHTTPSSHSSEIARQASSSANFADSHHRYSQSQTLVNGYHDHQSHERKASFSSQHLSSSSGGGPRPLPTPTPTSSSQSTMSRSSSIATLTKNSADADAILYKASSSTGLDTPSSKYKSSYRPPSRNSQSRIKAGSSSNTTLSDSHNNSHNSHHSSHAQSHQNHHGSTSSIQPSHSTRSLSQTSFSHSLSHINHYPSSSSSSSSHQQQNSQARHQKYSSSSALHAAPFSPSSSTSAFSPSSSFSSASSNVPKPRSASSTRQRSSQNVGMFSPQQQSQQQFKDHFKDQVREHLNSSTSSNGSATGGTPEPKRMSNLPPTAAAMTSLLQSTKQRLC